MLANRLYQHCFKLGISNSEHSVKLSKAQLGTKKCEIIKKDECMSPKQETFEKKARQPQEVPCDPNCTGEIPRLISRGCLPWEKAVELCPQKDSIRRLESPTCQHICEPYIGQGIINKLNMSTCEYRMFEKCFRQTRDPRKCLNLTPSMLYCTKTYPMKHAINKDHVLGGAINVIITPKPLDPDCVKKTDC